MGWFRKEKPQFLSAQPIYDPEGAVVHHEVRDKRNKLVGHIMQDDKGMYYFLDDSVVAAWSGGRDYNITNLPAVTKSFRSLDLVLRYLEKFSRFEKGVRQRIGLPTEN